MLISMTVGFSQIRGESGEISWELTNNNTILEISGNGNMPNYNHDLEIFPPWFNWRYQVKKIIIEENVKSISNESFMGFEQLETINIPKNCKLDRIGNRAFAYCRNLKSFEVPKSVKKIGSLAFTGSGLESIEIFYTVPPIDFDSNAFYGIEKCIIYVPDASFSIYQNEPRSAVNFKTIRPSSAKPVKGRYVIIVKSLNTKLEAEKHLDKLEKMYSYNKSEVMEPVTINGIIWYRISVWSFDDIKERKKWIDEWRHKEGIETAWAADRLTGNPI